MNSFSFQEAVLEGRAVLSVTGTMRSWSRNFGTMEGAERALWHIIAARFPPAEEPPMATLERSRESSVAAVDCSQRRASQESWTAAG